MTCGILGENYKKNVINFFNENFEKGLNIANAKTKLKTHSKSIKFWKWSNEKGIRVF